MVVVECGRGSMCMRFEIDGDRYKDLKMGVRKIKGDGMKRQRRMPLVEALREYGEQGVAYFCVPGHRFGRGVSERWVSEEERGVFRFDLTEAEGLDDLHQPEGVIREAQELLAECFGAEESFFLVNGTTCGNEAMILTVAGPGEKVVVPRNAHKSVMMGLVMSGSVPVYVMPEWNEEWGIWGGLDPLKVEECLREHSGCKGVFIVDPGYYGSCGDLKEVVRVCHEQGCLVMVDEAHGAHFYFSDRLPMGALALGADMCAQSFHKVSGSLTQSSVLHVGCKERVDVARLKANLQMVQSTSPSYLLMASLDAARSELAVQGDVMAEVALGLAEYVRGEIAKIDGIVCMDSEVVGKYSIKGIDLTRLVISAVDLGISGFELKRRLMEGYDVDTELADHHNVLAIVTFANAQEDVQRLVAGLRGIAETGGGGGERIFGRIAMPPLPEMVLTPREAHFKEKRSVCWGNAVGKVAGEAVIPYPPGIPVVYPGEMVSVKVWDYIEQLRQQGCHFQGVSDEKLETFKIISESMENS